MDSHQLCLKCGVSEEDWIVHGSSEGHKMYCCEGCANGTECLCQHVVAF